MLTVRQLREAIATLPDDAIVCVQFGVSGDTHDADETTVSVETYPDQSCVVITADE